VSDTDLCARCGGDCGMSRCRECGGCENTGPRGTFRECPSCQIDQQAAGLALEDGWEPCDHDCDEGCYSDYDEWDCRHQHCFACGGCGCPGYCDDHQTYNLRPGETGGAA
jgi:hypothetical protein